MIKILECYPFGLHSYTPVELIEGFKCYVGNLGDKPGDPHKGIDYVRKEEKNRFISFEVFSAHEGFASCGYEKSLGNFVLVASRVFEGTISYVYYTVYAHLKRLPTGRFPLYKPKNGEFWHTGPITGREIDAGTSLGTAGTTGWTNGIIQLHFELHENAWRDNEGWQRKKVDPYGINDDFTSGKYPRPGQSLLLITHYWKNDQPEFPH